jgi:hypothetical protein
MSEDDDFVLNITCSGNSNVTRNKNTKFRKNRKVIFPAYAHWCVRGVVFNLCHYLRACRRVILHCSQCVCGDAQARDGVRSFKGRSGGAPQQPDRQKKKARPLPNNNTDQLKGYSLGVALPPAAGGREPYQQSQEKPTRPKQEETKDERGHGEQRASTDQPRRTSDQKEGKKPKQTPQTSSKQAGKQEGNTAAQSERVIEKNIEPRLAIQDINHVRAPKHAHTAPNALPGSGVGKPGLAQAGKSTPVGTSPPDKLPEDSGEEEDYLQAAIASSMRKDASLAHLEPGLGPNSAADNGQDSTATAGPASVCSRWPADRLYLTDVVIYFGVAYVCFGAAYV